MDQRGEAILKYHPTGAFLMRINSERDWITIAFKTAEEGDSGVKKAAIMRSGDKDPSYADKLNGTERSTSLVKFILRTPTLLSIYTWANGEPILLQKAELNNI